MRIALCVALLTCCLGAGVVSAQDLTTAQAQQLVSAAKNAPANSTPVNVTLSINSKNVVFKVTRDAVGNVIARPVPGPDSAGIGISQVTIGLSVKSDGSLEPTTIVVIGENNTILSYQVSLNPDGSISGLLQAGTFAAGSGSGPKPIVGGINGNQTNESKKPNSQANGFGFNSTNGFAGFTSGQQSLPAGAGTGDISRSNP